MQTNVDQQRQYTHKQMQHSITGQSTYERHRLVSTRMREADAQPANILNSSIKVIRRASSIAQTKLLLFFCVPNYYYLRSKLFWFNHFKVISYIKITKRSRQIVQTKFSFGV